MAAFHAKKNDQDFDAQSFISRLPISPKKAVVFFGIIAAGLAVANLTGQFYKINGGDNSFFLQIVGKLDLDGEKSSLPTWFQSSVMLLCSFVLLLIAFIRREIRDADFRFWTFLAVVFLYLSLDETISIHEQASVPLRYALDAHGLLFFSWVIPAAAVMLLFFAFLFKFLWRLPVRLRLIFFLAGGIYISGALIMEMIGAGYYETHLELANIETDATYVILTTIEESLESAGLIVFIYSLLSHLTSDAARLPVSLKKKSFNLFKPSVAARMPVTANFRGK